MRRSTAVVLTLALALPAAAFMLGQASVPAGAKPLEEVGRVTVTSSIDGQTAYVWLVQGIQNEDKTTQTVVRYIGSCANTQGITISYTGLDEQGKFACKTQIFTNEKK